MAFPATPKSASGNPGEAAAPAYLLRIAHLWHLTSLDAPTVAVVWLLAFAWAANILLPLWLPCTLALATWAVYIGDRLLDARPAHSAASPLACNLRPRHYFHWRFRRFFIPAAAISGITAILLARHFMLPDARTRNTLLACAALAYFTSVHHPSRLISRFTIPKELLVAVLFTLTCIAPTWFRMASGQLWLLAPALAFIALAWLNCHAIEVWESPTSGSSSEIRRLALTGAALGLLAAAASFNQPRSALLLVSATASSLLLALLQACRTRLEATTLRAAADLVLLTPLLLLVMR